MKLVDIINLPAYSQLSKLPSLSKLHWSDQAKWCIIPPAKVGTMITGDTYVPDWRRQELCHSSKETCLLLLIFSLFFTPSTWYSCFLSRRPQGKLGGGGVCNIINNTVRMKGSGTLPPHPSVSPLFLSPCYSSMLNTSASAFACVAWIYMNVSPAGDNGGQVIDMCRRTQDKQPTPTGVTPACLIHFDWAKTEGWIGVGGQWNWGGLKARIKWQKGSFFHLVLQTATQWTNVNVKNHTQCLTRQDMPYWALKHLNK